MLNNQGRIPELDGVRGMAIAAVLIYHGFASSMVVAPYAWTGFSRWVESIASLGWMGVDLFFVLSGYLITGILLDSVGKAHYFRNFYARRALRILPLYFLILILIGLLSRGSGDYVLLGFFYLSNMAPIFGVAVIYGPLWSLSVEEHFYFLWPWLVSRLKLNGIRTLAIGVCIAEPVARVIGFHYWSWRGGGATDLALYSWFRFDGLAAGALLATFVRSKRCTKSRLYFGGLACASAAILLAAVAPPGTSIGFSLQYTCSTLLGASIVSVVLSGELDLLGRVARSRWLVKCGQLSYCLYIIHVLVFYCVWDAIGGEFPAWLVSRIGPFGTLCVRALVAYSVSFVLAELSRRYFEGPILRLKRHFVFDSTGASPAPPAMESAGVGVAGGGSQTT